MVHQVISIKEFFCKMTGIVKNFDYKSSKGLISPSDGVSMPSFTFQLSIFEMQKKLPQDYAWNFAG